MSKEVRNLGIALLVGLLAGWLLAGGWSGGRSSPRREWVAQVGDAYITPEMFIAEMHRRGGETPGQYQDIVQKRALLDDMVLRQALINAAKGIGLEADPVVRRQIEAALVNQYVEATLRKQQRAVKIEESETRAHYDAHAADYTVPARRRVAMIQIQVPANADEDVWRNATERAAEALGKAKKLAAHIPHLGEVAREYSQDQATRYRGGTIGWISEGQKERYRYDSAVIDAAMAAEKAGDFAPVVRGKDAVYVVRVVDIEPQRERPYEQLATGIHQRLLQDRMEAVEKQFRIDVLKNTRVQVREEGLNAIDPLAPPADKQPPQPPAMPNQ